ncbi:MULTISPECIES: class A beta-lactamase [unclassified Bradyrhizobium]|uniref:class A beta-lactamase n=1 Tax=unclassified Bradyrhizobium TaxID=2631580 RepID=UPI001BA4AE63|nr:MULTISPECIES: class A beta-lactamase [unclassified Bradyrhizobium]MBR1225763.1 class A beta-lactamase [Bradyrhizobium sp. AUGA SZCCT0176]MBR1301211.1 class A beta-lactamase [Bradyrhizobium sp. AUGA SZCCT0042]
MISRRQFHLGFGAALIAADLSGLPKTARAAAADQRLIAEIKRLESESGGRLGVCVLETATGARHVHRGDERFPMCSTFKALATAAVLARVDARKEQLTRRITFDASAIVVNSPVTEKHAGGDGMTLAEICDAAMTRSDNTAGNLLLASIGGPPGLTAFARGLGDQVTRLDRDEPSLNQALPDDLRDTTTPNAMASDFQALVLGTGALSAASREQLTAWLVANKTGDTRLRAGFAKGWRVGDKTGAGDHGTNNDVAVVWPPDGAPVIVAAYLTGASIPSAQQNATIASIARAVAAMRLG